MIFTLILFGIFFMIFLSYSNEAFSVGPQRCATECQPPTMGVNFEESRRYVDKGFGINGQFFDVEYFSQTIPTQNISVGETIDVTLKIFENSGTKYLEHVALSLVVEEPKIGEPIPTETESTITWKKKFDGTKSFYLNDPFDILNIINVTDHIENNRTILNFQFQVTEPIESKSLKVHMWDYRRNSWNNHFYNVLTITEPQILDFDFQPQERQFNLQESNQDIEIKMDSVIQFCKEGFEKIKKISDNTFACVKYSTAKKLVERGWGTLIF